VCKLVNDLEQDQQLSQPHTPPLTHPLPPNQAAEEQASHCELTQPQLNHTEKEAVQPID